MKTDPATYYAAHAEDEATYVAILVAREVKAGGEWWNGLFTETAKEDGYVAESYEHNRFYFMTAEEIAKRMEVVDGYSFPLSRTDLAGAKVEPVARGDDMTVTTLFGPEKQTAAHDGVVIVDEVSRYYKNNFELMAAFNYAGETHETHGQLLITQRGIPPMTGIILKENVTFTLHGRSVFATAGDLLYTNGYTHKLEVRKVNTPNLELRRVSRTAAEKQALMRGGARKMKPQ